MAEQKVKLEKKRIELQAAAGVPIIDPEKLDDLEKVVANIPRIDPSELSRLEKMILNKPSVDPNQIKALEAMIKKVDADSINRVEILQTSVATAQSARYKQNEREGESRALRVTKAMEDKIEVL